jgi:hypothetical protein
VSTSLNILWAGAPIAKNPLEVGDVLLVRRELTFANALHANAVTPADLYELEDELFFSLSDAIDEAASNVALIESGQWGGTPPMQSLEQWKQTSHLVPEAVEALQGSDGRVIVYARLRVQANALPVLALVVSVVAASIAATLSAYFLSSAIKHATDNGLEVVKLIATTAPDSPLAETADDVGDAAKLVGLALVLGSIAALLFTYKRP